MDLDRFPTWIAALILLGVVAFAIAVVVFAPLITIWALNLLFGLSIPATLATWAAAFWLSWIVSGGIRTSSNKKD